MKPRNNWLMDLPLGKRHSSDAFAVGVNVSSCKTGKMSRLENPDIWEAKSSRLVVFDDNSTGSITIFLGKYW